MILAGLATLAVAGLAVWAWFGPRSEQPTSRWGFPLSFALIGLAIALIVGSRLLGRRWPSGFGARRGDWGAPMGWPTRRRLTTLVRTADRADPHQREAAADLGRRMLAQRHLHFIDPAVSLLLAAQLIDQDPNGLGLLLLLASALNAAAFVIALRQDRVARTFLQ